MLDDDEGDDWDDDSDWESDDEPPTVPCPYCGREMLEDSPRCPHCERYISAEDHAAAGRPAWVVITAAVCLAAALWWLLRGI
jgi:uncharacterized protein (DUF983 family)